MKVTLIPIIIGGLGTIHRGLVKGVEDFEIRGQVASIQTTELMISVRILRRAQETWRDLMSLKLQWKTISKRWCENFPGVT